MEITSSIEIDKQPMADNSNGLSNLIVQLFDDAEFVNVINACTQKAVQLCCGCSNQIRHLQQTSTSSVIGKKNDSISIADVEAKNKYQIGEIEIAIAEIDFSKLVATSLRSKNRKRKNPELENDLDEGTHAESNGGWLSKNTVAKRRSSRMDFEDGILSENENSTENDEDMDADTIVSVEQKKKLTRHQYRKDLEMRRLLIEADNIWIDNENRENLVNPEQQDEIAEDNDITTRIKSKTKAQCRKNMGTQELLGAAHNTKLDNFTDTKPSRSEEMDELIIVRTPKRAGTSQGKVITSDEEDVSFIKHDNDEADRLSTDGYEVLTLNNVRTPKSTAKKQFKNSNSKQFAKKQHNPRQTKKPLQRNRRVVIYDEEDDEERLMDDDNDRQNTSENMPLKDKPIITKKKLTEQTREAEKAEKERRKRLEERQREFNGIELTTDSTTGEEMFAEVQNCAILKSIVLDLDKENETPCPVKVHPSLVRVLKKHQAEGIKFLYDCTIESLSRLDTGGGGGILAHCMGLGKTLQVIAFLHTILTHPTIAPTINKVLVVVPKNVVINWRNEFNRWLYENDPETDQLNPVDLEACKDNDDRLSAVKSWIENKRPSVLIIGYEMFRNLTLCEMDMPPPLKARKNDKAKKKLTKSQKHLEKLKIEFRKYLHEGPHMVVCDEGHKLKSQSTGISCTMNKIQTKRRICLTGTPIQNNLEEYYCMVNFVKPNLLGTIKEFQTRFANHIKRGRTKDATPFDVKYMRKRCHVLFERLKGILDRRDVGILRASLPLKLEYVINVRLTQAQIDLYWKYLEFCTKRDANSRGGFYDSQGRWRSKKGMHLIYDHIVLQRIWTHPYLLIEHKRDLERKQLLQDYDDFVVPDEADVDVTTPEHFNETEDAKENEATVTATDLVNLGPVVVPRTSTSDSSQNANASKSKPNEPTNEKEIQAKMMEELEEWVGDHCTDEDRDNFHISNKLLLLMEIIKKCEAIGDKLLVFSQFLGSIALIERMLTYMAENNQWFVDGHEPLMAKGEKWSWELGKDYAVIDGSVSSKDRDLIQTTFNDIFNLRGRLLLISTKAGSLGTNLVGANRVVIFDCCWNPSHDTQSLFRVYRYGQTKPVYIYRFIAQGTMEERIYRKGVTKESISKRVTESAQIQRHYTNEELEDMYHFDPAPAIDQTQNGPVLDPPRDRLLGDIILKGTNTIVNYHPHDVLFDELEDEKLTEEEREEAWKEYEREQQPHAPPPPPPPPLSQNGQTEDNSANVDNMNITKILLQMQALMETSNVEQQRPTEMALPKPPELIQQRPVSLAIAYADHSYHSFVSPQKILDLHRQRFKTDIDALFLRHNDDVVYKNCLRINGMTHKIAMKIFQIKQFLCYFIYQLPENKRGLIHDAEKFNELFMGILQRAIETGENASWVQEKVYIILNSTITFAHDVPECVIGTAFITDLFPEAFTTIEQ